MDLIYTNKNKLEQGVVRNYSLDMEDATTSSARCTFEVQLPSEDNFLEIGSYLYIPNTDIGGRVDALKVDTASKTIYASGRTWRGLLATKLFETSTQVNTNASMFFSEKILSPYAHNMGAIFSVVTNTEMPSSNVTIPAYEDLYTAMVRCAVAVNHKINIKYDEVRSRAVISFVPIADYTSANAITSDMFEFKASSGAPRVNHAIGVSGSMKVHRYLQANGSVSNTMFYTGIDEIMRVFEIPSVANTTELTTKTDEALLSAQISDSMEVTALNLNADLGDKFTAEDIQTGISMTQYVTHKITKINHDIIQYQYEVGARRL